VKTEEDMRRMPHTGLPVEKADALGTYEIRRRCLNCGRAATFEFPKGVPAHDKDCPHCGCRRGVAVW
jgi:hypothetical protein